MSLKLSIIVPVYNVEDYLPRCLNSILQQPYGDYELIAVNDGSTDSSLQILHDYARSHPQFRIIDQVNAGLGGARNSGLKAAKGEYVWFIDSDDWITDCCLPRLDRIIAKHQPDVVFTNYVFAYADGSTCPPQNISPHLYGKLVQPLELDETSFGSISCWNSTTWRSICRRVLLLNNKLAFPSKLYYEDHEFAINLMLCAKSVYVDGGVSYFYFQRHGSISKSQNVRCFDFLQVRYKCLEVFRNTELCLKYPNIYFSYLFPKAFIDAHVPRSLKAPFFKALRSAVSPEDLSRSLSCNDLSVWAFGSGMKYNSYLLFQTFCFLNRFRQKAVRRLLGSSSRRIKGLIGKGLNKARRLKQRLAKGSIADLSTLVDANPSSRLEHIAVDVRVAPQPRKYICVNEGSLVSGTFVFERGLGTVSIGSHTTVGSGCLFICSQAEGISVGSNTMISWDCTIIDTNAHHLSPEHRRQDGYMWKLGLDANMTGVFKDWTDVESRPIKIGDSVWIGFGATILPGVTVGNGAVVGAQSVVTRDVPPDTVVAGNPARVIRKIERWSGWKWEKICELAQDNIYYKPLMSASYMSVDRIANIESFVKSQEFSHTLKILRDFSPNAHDILDVGCGNGTTSIALASAGYRVVGLDISDNELIGIKSAQKILSESKYQEVKSSVEFLCYSVDELPISQQFDVIYCRQVIHHFPDPLTTLKHLFNCLRPGGILVAVREHVVFNDEDKALFLRTHPFHRFYFGENAYTNDEYKSIFRSAGFEVKKELTFFESIINHESYPTEVFEAKDEAAVPGRMYTYIVRRPC